MGYNNVLYVERNLVMFLTKRKKKKKSYYKIRYQDDDMLPETEY